MWCWLQAGLKGEGEEEEEKLGRRKRESGRILMANSWRVVPSYSPLTLSLHLV
jgi:hypothetical protein